MQSSPRIEELRQKFHENPRRYFAPLANEYRKAGDPEQAIAICRAHLAQQPAHMSGHVVYGQALYDAHRIDEAREVFQLALALDPENIIVLRHLGDIARQRGDVQEARSWYSRALDGDPHDAEVAAYLAELTEPLVSHGVEPELAIPIAEVPSPIASEGETTDSAKSEPTVLEDEAAAPIAHDTEIAATIPRDVEVVSETSVEGAPELDESPYLETEELAARNVPPPEAAPHTTERQSRLTPTGEGFPILTRTLAELYLQQGHLEAALDIYRQLAEHEPHDADIRARIAALTPDAHVGAVPVSEEPSASEAERASEVDRAPDSEPPREEDRDAEPEPEHVLSGEAVDEQVVEEELREAADFTGGDELEIAEVGGGYDEMSVTPQDDELAVTTLDDGLTDAAPETELSLNDINWPEIGTGEISGLAGAPVDRETSDAEPSDKLWDTADFLGGGFFEDTLAEDEIFGLSDDALSVARQGQAATTPLEPAPPATPPEAEPEEIVTASEAEPEDVVTEAQSAEMAAEGDPSELAAEKGQKAEMESAGVPPEFVSANLAAAAYFENPEPGGEESPYAPESSEKATHALTIREFFATLGSMRPPFINESEEASPIADAVPDQDAPAIQRAPVADEAYPFADDAFANLFANAPISAADSRAATALSSAVAHGAPFATPSTPSGPRRRSPSPPREMPAQPGQESEEDIRRFREWLDGLAET